ncbi:MAG TPA: hypothetical protein VEI97_01595, partial [bacterium]|nr:hypothetical protein [bacterium]
MLVLAVAGCGRNTPPPTHPAAPAPQATAEAGFPVPPGPATAAEALAGRYRMEIALETDGPHVSVMPVRRAQETDDLTFLSIQDFFKPGDLAVDGIADTGEEIRVAYTIRHPFPAPRDLDAASHAFSNRADLGFTGRLLFLLPVDPAHGSIADFTFFRSAVAEVRANTAVVRNADGYFQPRGLLGDPSLNTNTFPYKLVVDEAAGPTGNRVGVGNGGTPRGNYDPAAGGWQRANMGPDRNGWTGYDFLHQGQAASSELRLDRATLALAPLRFDVAVIAKYPTAVGGATADERKANRLPPASYDPGRFVYRLPHGALDVGVVQFRGETGGLSDGDDTSETTLRATVRDWDARATATTRADLADDPNPSTTYIGEVGVPDVEIDIPAVILSNSSLVRQDNDEPIGGDPTPESGESDDPIYFEGTVANQRFAGAGVKRGLIRAYDINITADRSGYELALGPGLVPLTSDRPGAVTYQAFTVEVKAGPGNLGPTAEVVIDPPAVCPTDPLHFLVNAEQDPEGDTVFYDIDVDYTGTFEPDVTGLDPARTPPPGLPLYDADTTSIPGGAHEARVRVYDGISPFDSFLAIPYDILACDNFPPVVEVQLAGGPNPEVPSLGTLQFELRAEKDPEGDPV